jgi:hypothetical protein
MNLVDRTGKEHKMRIALVKDIKVTSPYIAKACNLLNLDNLRTYLQYPDIDSNVEENIEAINELLLYMTDDTDNFDIVMMKQAITWFVNQKKRYDEILPYQKKELHSVPFHERVSMQFNFYNALVKREEELKILKLTPKEEQQAKLETELMIKAAQEIGLIEEDEHMIDALTVGTTVTGRNGKTYKAYSHLITEYKEAIELLSKVDAVNIASNVQEEDPEAYEALLEIIFRAFNREVPKDEILEILDAELAKKVIRVYFDVA